METKKGEETNTTVTMSDEARLLAAVIFTYGEQLQPGVFRVTVPKITIDMAEGVLVDSGPLSKVHIDANSCIPIAREGEGEEIRWKVVPPLSFEKGEGQAQPVEGDKE